MEKGAEWKSSVKALAQSSDVIITMVGYPKDVEEVYFGSEGIIENAKTGSYLIDMTTSKPSLAKQIEDAAKERGLYTLDAPVSGGDVGARNGTLAIMVGGERKAFDECYPIFSIMGENIQYQGRPEAGSIRKCATRLRLLQV